MTVEVHLHNQMGSNSNCLFIIGIMIGRSRYTLIILSDPIQTSIHYFVVDGEEEVLLPAGQSIQAKA